MRWCVAVVLFSSSISLAHAETLSPWFGSEASPPEQVSDSIASQQTIDSTQISATEVAITCPIEGCRIAGNFVKQPK